MIRRVRIMNFLLTRISHEVAMLAGQKDKRNLLVACSESDQNLKKQQIVLWRN